jgi:hypothetical protein
VFHQGQRLSLGLETSHHPAGVHSRLEHFQGDFAAHRPLLLGHEDNTEPAFADLFQQLVRPDHAAGPIVYARVVGRTVSGGLGHRFQEAAVLLVHAQ